MKRLVWMIGMICSFLSVSAQQADARIGDLINKADWFTLEKEYSLLKDSMQMDFLKLLAQTMIATNFNQPQKAIESIHQLLSKHQQEIGFGNSKNLVLLAASIDAEQGLYAKAADGLKNFIDQLKALGITEGRESSIGLYQHFNKLRHLPAPSLSRPDKDVVVPISIEKVQLPTSIEKKGWRGTHIYVPVTIHGKEYRFIFDTGAGTTYFSEKLAKQIGIPTVYDSLRISGGAGNAAIGKLGYLDSLQVSDITFRDIPVTIAPVTDIDTVLQVDAILGIDFIKQVGEFQIYPQQGKIVFPAHPTPLPATGKNLLLTTDKCPLLKASSDNDRLMFIFDTGCTTAALYYPYYAKYKEQLDATGVKETNISGGFNLIQKKEILRIPSVSFKIGETPVEMKDIQVSYLPEPDNGPTEDGILGMSLINQYGKVTVNLKDMFALFE